MPINLNLHYHSHELKLTDKGPYFALLSDTNAASTERSSTVTQYNYTQLFCNCPLFAVVLIPGLYFHGKLAETCCHSVVASK